MADSETYEHFTLVRIVVTVTEAGLKDVRGVTDLVYAYLALLREQVTLCPIWDEQQRIRSVLLPFFGTGGDSTSGWASKCTGG